MDDSMYFWDDLLQFIEECSVIPIIGPELLSIEIGGKTIPLYQYLAAKLAESLEMGHEQLPAGTTLDQVMCQYLRTPGSRREILYRRMRSVLTETTIPVPEPLRKLAGIRHFNLYINTTIDSLLEQAIDEVRFGGSPKTGSLVYTLSEVKDLPCEVEKLTAPTVFYLFGRATSLPNYVLTEEDTLEFIHSLQSETRRPLLLFDELKCHHLLLIGTSYSNWLGRFFIRTVRNERLMVPVDRETIWAGEDVSRDENLVLFLNSPLSYGVKVFDHSGVVDFVDELYDRWNRSNPSSEAESAAPSRQGEDMPEMPSGAIFLSYGSEDLETVAKVKETLEEAGLDVWFDKPRLEGGDDFDLKIRRNIARCALFCPFISQNTEHRQEGYFRREWNYAVDRALGIDDSVPFILPVALDDISVDTARVPEKFRRVHWTRSSGGILSPEFVLQMVKLVREYRKREREYA